MDVAAALRASAAVMATCAATLVGAQVPGSYCGHHYDLYLDPNLTDRVRAATVEAALDWESRVELTITLHQEPVPLGGCDVDCFTLAMAPPAQFPEGKIGFAFASHDCHCGRIIINEDLEPQVWTQALVAHEIGHMLGLHHAPGFVVMHENIGQGAERVTCADAEHFYRLRGETPPDCKEE